MRATPAWALATYWTVVSWPYWNCVPGGGYKSFTTGVATGLGVTRIGGGAGSGVSVGRACVAVGGRVGSAVGTDVGVMVGGAKVRVGVGGADVDVGAGGGDVDIGVAVS
jgi:hypothetical protein